ncbi:MAG: endonuclease/exonuclease/phosphatase family protein [Spirochaetota bacterium]
MKKTVKKTVKKKSAKKAASPAKKTAVKKAALPEQSAVKKTQSKKMSLAMKALVSVLGFFAVLISAGLLWVYFSTYHPDAVEQMPVKNSGNAPVLAAGQKVKIMSWNVQFMAGKNYEFFFDKAVGQGPDTRPSAKDVAVTLGEVVRVIKAEKPDVILLQEVDVDSKRTDNMDQMARLLDLLPKEYSCSTSAWYWKADFVPHPKVMGSAGVKNVIISKYKIKEGIRYQLPLMPDNIIIQQANFKRAILEAKLEVKGGKDLSVLCTHLDAFAQGNNTMELQVALMKSILEKRTKEGAFWAIGGDFNLLAPGKAY